MARTQIEIEVDGKRIEYAYGLAQEMQANKRQDFADTGYRAALARDQKMLKVMEKAAEYVVALGEQQRGRTRRAAAMTNSGTYHDTAEFTEVAMWREAYRLMDEGKAIRNFEWIYGAGAWLAGYIVR